MKLRKWAVQTPALPTGLAESPAKLHHRHRLPPPILFLSPVVRPWCQSVAASSCRLLLPSPSLSQALLLKSPALWILSGSLLSRGPTWLIRILVECSVSGLGLVGREEPLRSSKQEKPWSNLNFIKLLQQQSEEWASWGGNGVAKGPFKRTLHLRVQGFGKRQLAACTIYYVCSLNSQSQF